MGSPPSFKRETISICPAEEITDLASLRTGFCQNSEDPLYAYRSLFLRHPDTSLCPSASAILYMALLLFAFDSPVCMIRTFAKTVHSFCHFPCTRCNLLFEASILILTELFPHILTSLSSFFSSMRASITVNLFFFFEFHRCRFSDNTFPLLLILHDALFYPCGFLFNFL